MRKLLELLQPILADHADLVEAVLPSELRSNWRQAVAFQHRQRGNRPRDDRDLLLAMAELDSDLDGPADLRQVAGEVVSRFPLEAGAGDDERQHVCLPDGSRPARDDLIGRLVEKHSPVRDRLRGEVAAARQAADRMRKRAERIRREGLYVPRGRRPMTPIQLEQLAEGARQMPKVTAHQADAVWRAVRKKDTPSS